MIILNHKPYSQGLIENHCFVENLYGKCLTPLVNVFLSLGYPTKYTCRLPATSQLLICNSLLWIIYEELATYICLNSSELSPCATKRKTYNLLLQLVEVELILSLKDIPCYEKRVQGHERNRMILWNSRHREKIKRL